MMISSAFPKRTLRTKRKSPQSDVASEALHPQYYAGESRVYSYTPIISQRSVIVKQCEVAKVLRCVAYFVMKSETSSRNTESWARPTSLRRHVSAAPFGSFPSAAIRTTGSSRRRTWNGKTSRCECRCVASPGSRTASRRMPQNPNRALALHFVYYNFCRKVRQSRQHRRSQQD